MMFKKLFGGDCVFQKEKLQKEREALQQEILRFSPSVLVTGFQYQPDHVGKLLSKIEVLNHKITIEDYIEKHILYKKTYSSSSDFFALVSDAIEYLQKIEKVNIFYLTEESQNFNDDIDVFANLELKLEYIREEKILPPEIKSRLDREDQIIEERKNIRIELIPINYIDYLKENAFNYFSQQNCIKGQAISAYFLRDLFEHICNEVKLLLNLIQEQNKNIKKT